MMIVALLSLLFSMAINSADAQTPINPDGTLPSDPTGEEAAAAPHSLAALRRFNMDAAWDHRLWIASPCGEQSDLWSFRLEVTLQARIRQAILATTWPDDATKKREVWRTQGALDAAAQAGGHLAIRNHHLMCDAVLSKENMLWMTAALRKDRAIERPDVIPVGTVPLPLNQTIASEEAGETALRCGLRSREWRDRLVRNFIKQGGAPRSDDIYQTVSIELQQQYIEGAVDMNRRWSDWEATQLPDGGCTTVAAGSDLSFDDAIAGR